MIKSTIAAVAASPFLFAGAAFAGPYVNLEATGSYPEGAYASGGLEAVVGYEGATESLESDTMYLVVLQSLIQKLLMSLVMLNFVGYVGATYDKFYGEVSGVTTPDDEIDWSAKAGVKFTF